MSNPTPDHPPLWRVMSGASNAHVMTGRPNADRLAAAAVIRAVRDYWLPEEEELDYQPPGITDEICWADITDAIRWAAFAERQRLRALLTTYADQAERGDG